MRIPDPYLLLESPRSLSLPQDPGLLINLLLTKKDVQLESCELSFIWGKMRTAAWEAASQIALRDCSKVAVGEGQYILCLGEGRLQCHEALILQKVFVGHEDLTSPRRDLVLL